MRFFFSSSAEKVFCEKCIPPETRAEYLSEILSGDPWTDYPYCANCGKRCDFIDRRLEAPVVEQADTTDLKSVALQHPGSIPGGGTK